MSITAAPGFRSTAFSRLRPLPRPCARPLPPPSLLTTDLLAQWTCPPRPRCRPCLKLHEHPFTTCTFTDAHRSIAIAIITLVVKNFPSLEFASLSASVTLFQAHRYLQAKWHCHRPRRSVQHRDVKGFIYVKKIPVFQGCVCVPMTWQVAERETAHL